MRSVMYCDLSVLIFSIIDLTGRLKSGTGGAHGFTCGNLILIRVCIQHVQYAYESYYA